MTPRATVAVGVAFAVLTVAGCTSAATQAPTAARTPTTTHVPTSPAASAARAASPALVARVQATIGASAKPARGATPAARSTCTSIGIRVIRGSAAGGREFAALQFTNTGAATCRLNGYPSVTLLRGGAGIGTPSAPASSRPSTYRLASGETAESTLNDYTNCSAPLSDTIRVVAPGSALTATRPAQLRACSVRVGALGKPQ